MELKNVIEILNKKHKGTFVKVIWESQIQSAKAAKMGIKVTKRTEATVRWGVQYDHLAKVKKMKEERSENNNPVKDFKPWYKHLDNASYIIQHLSDPSKTYLQLYTINNKKAIKSTYYINDKIATKQEVQESGYVNNSEWNNKSETIIMNIPTNNICCIGKQEG